MSDALVVTETVEARVTDAEEADHVTVEVPALRLTVEFQYTEVTDG